MEEKRSFRLNFRGKNLVVEVGELAKQANAACVVLSKEKVDLQNKLF